MDEVNLSYFNNKTIAFEYAATSFYKEQETKSVAVRYLGSKNQENLDLETFIENVKRKCLPPDLV